MKKYTLLFSILTMIFTNAQISVGVPTPHASAILDLDVSALSAKKGFLFPRLNLLSNSDIITIPTPASGLMAYNYVNAGSGTTLIKGNRISVWDASKWQNFSNLSEIRTLKTPIEFVMRTIAIQSFSTSNLTTVNASGVIPLEWIPSDVSVSNTTDIEFEDANEAIRFKTDSYYSFSGSINFKANTANNTTSATQVIVTLQKMLNGSSIWTNIQAVILPLEVRAVNITQTITIPFFVYHFAVGDKLRIVLSKPIGATSYISGSGIITTSAVDISKSLRIIRLSQ